jgi:hypothetical protein
MRGSRSGVVGVAVLATLISVLLSGCELREGPKSEYGESLAGHGLSVEKTAPSELLPVR